MTPAQAQRSLHNNNNFLVRLINTRLITNLIKKILNILTERVSYNISIRIGNTMIESKSIYYLYNNLDQSITLGRHHLWYRSRRHLERIGDSDPLPALLCRAPSPSKEGLYLSSYASCCDDSASRFEPGCEPGFDDRVLSTKVVIAPPLRTDLGPTAPRFVFAALRKEFKQGTVAQTRL